MSTASRDLSLILVPGLLCNAHVWSGQLDALADLAALHVADHGMLDSLPDMARRILEQAPARFAIAGHSMGGRVALEVFRLAPERVLGIALMDTGYQPLPPGAAGEAEKAGRFDLLATAQREGMRAMARRWVQGMVHPARLTDHALIEGILDMFESRSAEVYAAQIRALLSRPDGTPLLAQIRCPALVLCGHEDQWSPVARHQEMAQSIPGSMFVDIPECGHMSTLERPEAVSEAMRAWLQAVIQAQGNASMDAPRVAAARGR